MEINLEGRLRRTEQLVRADGQKKEAGEAAAPAPQPETDSVTLVRQALEQLAEQNRRITALLQQDQEEDKKVPSILDMVDGGAESGDSEADALGEQLKTMERCHKIASRIMRGDKVPPQDEQYLMLNDPEGYKLALSMRKPKKHPKEWESVLKDEDEDKSSEDGGGEAVDEAASCEASGEASGGDGASGGGSAPDGE